MNTTTNKQISYDFSSKELIYLQNAKGAIIFCEKFLKLNHDFANEYIQNFLNTGSEYNCDFQISSQLYLEHIESLKNNEICWKYSKRFGKILKTTLYLDKNNEISIKSEFISGESFIETTYFIIKPEAPRKIINETVFGAKLSEIKSIDLLAEELKPFINFIFEKFKQEGTELLDGLAMDAVPSNCTLKSNIYNLFDLEFNLKFGVERNLLVYRICENLKSEPNIKTQLYENLCKYYNLQPNSDYFFKVEQEIWANIFDEPIYLSSQKNDLKNFEKYFIN